MGGNDERQQTPARQRAWLARRLLRAVALLVPDADRRRWLQEWDGELAALRSRRRAGGPRHPSTFAFLIGAIPHSLWERKEWTMTVLLQDVRYAVRVLLRAPGFSLMAVATVALGVGAGTTIFSLVNATLLRPPGGLAAPERLVQIGRDRASGFDVLGWPFSAAFEDAGRMARVAAYSRDSFVVGRGADTQVLAGEVVSGRYFEVLGVRAAAGRLLQPADDVIGGAAPVVVLSGRLWRERFAADPAAVGQDLHVNGRELRIVGVADPAFRGPDVLGSVPDVWVPLALAPAVLGSQYQGYDRPGFSWLQVVARLSEGTTVEQARAELSAIYATRYQEAWGEPPDEPLGVVAGLGLRPDERPVVSQLMGTLLVVAAVVMLVASANLGNLMLARGSTRIRELGIRAALGAGRARIVRQLVTESALLAVAGGVVALAVTVWTSRLLPLFLPVRVAPDFAPDRTVLAFGLAASLAVGVLFGLLPAVRIAGGGDLQAALREGSSQAGRGGLWLRRALVIGQLALSFLLLVSAGLLVQSVRNAQDADPGYNTRDVLTVILDLDLAGYAEPEGRAFVRQLQERVAALPGVTAAAMGSNVPFGGWSRWGIPWPEGAARPPGSEDYVQLDSAVVSGSYFEALQIPVLAGEVALAEAAAGPPAVIVSESAARLLFPQRDPVGALLPRGDDPEDEVLTVIGVVADVHNRDLRSPPRPSIYVPAAQRYSGRLNLFVRTAGAPQAVAPAVRDAILDLDPNMGILSVRTLQERMGASLAETLTVSRTASAFGLLALALAGVGLYGVIAYLTARRSHEVGVRVALGARAGDVVALVLRQGAALAAVGLAVGLALSLLAGGLLASLLYGLSPRDPALMAASSVVLLLVALVATAIPALRATRTDPLTALRSE